ncbi:HDOD domain-containing protein [Rubinisphaera italica]|uniref:HDOD domain protein n=1 Tax=Rubinisphaera italica TaxID=2527969 RepID=A0A5C5XCW1_9PLAN|nr:HDOD domain-containing protein [Rubinisphaera italica]TWT60906.1 HDOD domain protein [Rubinisphaera italica]
MTQQELPDVLEWIVPPIVGASLDKIRHIATLPAVAHKIMSLVNDVNATAKDVNKIMAADPALCARILKVVNSTFYGLPQQIASIDRAVMLLGFNAVKNIAIAASLDKLFRTTKIGSHFDARDLWAHSIAVATGARALAKDMRLALTDEAFLAGLIHDIGITIEMQACPQKFADMTEVLASEPNLAFRQVEERVLGATHESFGAALCRKWQFPLKLEHVVRFHHKPMLLPESDRVLPAIIHVADILAARTGIGYTRTVETVQVDQQILNELDLSEDDIEAVADTLPDAILETQQLFNV